MENIKVINEYECAFCGQKIVLKIKDVVVDEETGRERGFGMDGWTCHTCGNDTTIYDDIDYLDFSGLTDENLFQKDSVELFLFSEYLISKKELEKAAKIMKLILSKDPEYYECKTLLEDVEKVIEARKVSKGLKVDMPRLIDAIDDHSDMAEWYLNTKTGEIDSLCEFDEEDLKRIGNSNDYIFIKPIDSREAYKKMEYFIENMIDEEDDKDLKEKLEIAINGPGAFRRVRDVLANYTGTVEYRHMWLDFYNSFVWNEAMDFLIWVFRLSDEEKMFHAPFSTTKESQNNAEDPDLTEPIEHIEINGVNYPLFIEEKDVEICKAKFTGNKVVITISSKLNNECKKHVIKNLKKKLQKPRRKRFLESVKEYENGDVIDLGKRKYNIKIDSVEKNSSSARLIGNTIHIILANGLSEDRRNRHVYELVRKIISSDRVSYLRKKLKELNRLYFNARFKDVKWKKQLTKWGSCSENGNISISYRLMFAPENVLEYVCIHELAHLIVFNHKERFWNLVKKAMPDYKEKEQWLKDNGIELM